MHSPWVNRQIESLTLEEMIAQLFWIGLPANVSKDNIQTTIGTIKKYKPGGVLFFKNSPNNVVSVANELQKHSPIPLIMAIDGEWGLGMRLQNTISYPYNMTLGAIQANQLIEELGYEIGRQFRHIGIHVNLAPVADINTNSKNPVIGRRSFGENPKQVAQKATFYMLGLQNAGVAAVAKHFPGHGDTDGDSHKLLPISRHSKERLDSVELLPFRTLVRAGVMGMMGAHIELPIVDPTPGLPGTLSKAVTTQLLKEEMGFKGFVITDGMNMQGVLAAQKEGNVDARAIIAGNDVIELSVNIPRAIDEIKKAIDENRITHEEIEFKCRKTLALKEWCGLETPSANNATEAASFINRPYAHWLNEKLLDASLTVLKNDNILPFRGTEASIVQFNNDNTVFDHLTGNTKFTRINASGQTSQSILEKTKTDESVFILIENTAQVNNTILQSLLHKRRCVIVYLGNPYRLDRINGLDKANAIVIQYENTMEAQKSISKFISGNCSALGRLPVTTAGFNCGWGIDTPKNQ